MINYISGLVPLKRTFRFKSATSQRFPHEKSNKWAEITNTVAHIAALTYKRASIEVKNYTTYGRPRSGNLILELDADRLELYQPFLKFLQNGGFCNQLPIVDLNQAYVNSKFAAFVEDDYAHKKPILPTFSAAKYQRFVQKAHGEYEESLQPILQVEPDAILQDQVKLDEDPLSTEIRKMKICDELQDFFH